MNQKKIKILMFITDFSAYKTFLDLKNYLYNHGIDNVELRYFFFPYSYAHSYRIEKYNVKMDISITRAMEKDYTYKKYGYAEIFFLFVESLMTVLKNYVNGKEDLLSIINTNKLALNIIDWNNTLHAGLSKQKFNNIAHNIPKADIYLISNRLNIANSASITVEIALALYLIRQYGSKVFIGGGHFNEPNNILVELINAIGREYTGGKLEYLVGTIGINIYNYLKGYEYQNKRSPIERNVLPLHIGQYDMANKFNNSFAIELIRGCKNKCSYCCNHVINEYDSVDISVYEPYFKYLNEYYPDTTINLCAPEMNTDKEYFIRTCEYIYKNIKNPVSFFINLSRLDDEQFEYLSKLNIDTLEFSIDNLFDKHSYKNWNNFPLYIYLDRLQELKRNKNIRVYAYLVANAPCSHLIDWNTYKNIFTRYSDIINYSEFYLMTSIDYFHNPQKYGISFIYYRNRYKETSNIRKVIEKLPVMYFREDVNRKELVNMKYDILRHLKKQMFVDMIGLKHNNNIHFALGQMCHIYPDLDLVDNRDSTLDKYIMNYTNNVGYKLQPTKNILDTLQKIYNKIY